MAGAAIDRLVPECGHRELDDDPVQEDALLEWGRRSGGDRAARDHAPVRQRAGLSRESRTAQRLPDECVRLDDGAIEGVYHDVRALPR